jgi:hypothetical protein
MLPGFAVYALVALFWIPTDSGIDFTSDVRAYPTLEECQKVYDSLDEPPVDKVLAYEVLPCFKTDMRLVGTETKKAPEGPEKEILK